MAASKFVDQNNQPVTLGRELGRGGEAVVYEVAGRSDLVAKIYHSAPGVVYQTKLRALVSVSSADLLRFAAWPAALLYDNQLLRGFTMPRISGFREIHALYGVAHRRREFPSADWQFLVHAALNCAVSVGAVHQRGFVIGDVNQKNVLVSPQATVRLLDCDSFQVSVGGKVLPCEVGVLEYTPPELQGRSFAGLVRTPNHDGFGLAIHVFQLLFMGRHPYAGKFLAGEKSLSDAIREQRFVYGRMAKQYQMQAPPNSLTLNLVPDSMQGLFERAFGPQLAAKGRPTAADWQHELSQLLNRLSACRRERSHKFSSHLKACPWCASEDQGGPLFFITMHVGGLKFVCGPVELSQVWADVDKAPILKLQPPTTTVAAPPAPTSPPPAALLGRRRLRLAQGTTGAGVATLLGWFFLAVRAASWPSGESSGSNAVGTSWHAAFDAGFASELSWLTYALLVVVLLGAGAWIREEALGAWREETHRRRGTFRRARDVAEALLRQWNETTDQYALESSELRKKLERLRSDYLALQPAFDEEMRRLGQEKEKAQLRDFLDAQYIENAQISKIGPGRKATLRGFGIETALDIVERLGMDIPGFGAGLKSELSAWARQVSAKFRFDPRKGIPEAERRLRVAEYRRRQIQMETGIKSLAHGLRELSIKSERRLTELAVHLEGAQKRLAISKADLSLIRHSHIG